MTTQQNDGTRDVESSGAILLESFGGPENLAVRNAPAPQAQAGEIRVRVTAAGLKAGRVDAAVVLLPVEEPSLVTGLVFSRQPQTLAVSVDHARAGQRELAAEQLAEISLVPVAGSAPEYWQRVHSPRSTPGGRPIPTRGGARTVQEGLSQVASSQSGLLLCAATAEYSGAVTSFSSR